MSQVYLTLCTRQFLSLAVSCSKCTKGLFWLSSKAVSKRRAHKKPSLPHLYEAITVWVFCYNKRVVLGWLCVLLVDLLLICCNQGFLCCKTLLSLAGSWQLCIVVLKNSPSPSCCEMTGGRKAQWVWRCSADTPSVLSQKGWGTWQQCVVSSLGRGFAWQSREG